MPIKTKWLVEGRVILSVYTGDVTKPEYIDANNVMNRLLNQGQFPVHVIIDHDDAESVPTNITETLTLLTWLAHDNLGWHLISRPRAEVKFTSAVVSQANDNRYREFPDRIHALEFLEEIDDSLKGHLLED